MSNRNPKRSIKPWTALNWAGTATPDGWHFSQTETHTVARALSRGLIRIDIRERVQKGVNSAWLRIRNVAWK